MAKFVRASMEGWVSYLKDPAPGNALIKQDNPKMTDDLLAWGVTQIREHHLIDGGGCRQPGLGDDDRRALAEDPRLYGQRRFAGGGHRLETGLHYRNLFRPCRLNPEERRHVINY